MDNPMHILVTGGAGFIGSHLCRKLLADGNKVICIDNLSTGMTTNISHLKGAHDFTFIKRDIRYIKNIDIQQVDILVHLGCPASPEYYFNFPIYTLETGVLGTRNMLNLARKHGARFMFASTSEVYGDPLISPQVETYYGNVNTMSPRSVYDESKRLSETLISTYSREYGIDVRIMRIFNTYGPNMRRDDGRVVSNFIMQALNGVPITIYGDGSQTRSFCYISDLIDGIMRLLSISETHDVNLPINLGNPQEITIRELAGIIKELTESKSNIISISSSVDDPRRRLPDINRAKKILGWRPRITIKDGLRKTIDYFRGINNGR